MSDRNLRNMSANNDLPMESSSQDSYLDQLSDSMNNFMFGIGLLVVTVFFMWTLEGAVVKFFGILKRAQMACRFVKVNTVINPDFQNRVVLVKGVSKLNGSPVCNTDSETGFKADITKGNVLRLQRTAQMYQWTEHKHTKKGSTGKTSATRDEVYYTYALEWSEVDEDSSQFHDNAASYLSNSGQNNNHDVYNQGGGGGIQYHDSTHMAHENPRERLPGIHSKSTDASVSIGAYKLSTRQISMMQNFLPCEINPADVANAPHKPSVEIDINASKQKIYYLTYKPQGASRQCSLDNPEVGMVRVTYKAVVENGHITTVGVQNGSTFRPFTEADAKKYEAGACFGFCGGGGDDAMDDGGSGSGSGSGGYSALSIEERGGIYGDDEEGNDNDNDGIDLVNGSKCGIVADLINKCVSTVVGNDVLLLEEKWASIKDVFKHSTSQANLRVMIMRIIAMLLMWLAISAIFDPIRTILSFIPLIGGFAASLFSVVTGILAFLLGMTIIAVSWVAFHPEILFALLLGVGLVCVMWGSGDWDTTGYVLSALSIYPFLSWVNLMNENRRFAAAQHELDTHHATLTDATATQTPLVSAVRVGSGSEKSGLLRA